MFFSIFSDDDLIMTTVQVTVFYNLTHSHSGSIRCYRSKKHSECAENFYREQCEEQAGEKGPVGVIALFLKKKPTQYLFFRLQQLSQKKDQ